ncbi:MAG: hypothetical protein JWN40_4221 [Phycisphaerales bacterium]|nr:hypothetical protein [Phycisphaerales bacterium]
MIKLTPEQREAMARQQEYPARAIDPDTQTGYVLIREEVYDRVKALFEEDESQFLGSLHPHVMEVFGKAGWDDPAMDVYDELDPRRKP